MASVWTEQGDRDFRFGQTGNKAGGAKGEGCLPWRLSPAARSLSENATAGVKLDFSVAVAWWEEVASQERASAQG